MGGYIKLFRQMTNWEWYKEPNTKAVFLHLLLVANHAPGRWQGIEIDRGQHLTSIKKLAEETGLTAKNVRTALDHLEKTGEVARLPARKWTLITVEKYELYQGDDSEGGKVAGKQVAKTWQGAGKVLATNKNNNNKKNKKNDYSRETRERRTITFADGASGIYVGGLPILSEAETKDLLRSNHEAFIRAMKERKMAQ